LISSWMQFLFVGVVPRYQNCSSFPKCISHIFTLWCPACWSQDIIKYSVSQCLLLQSCECITQDYAAALTVGLVSHCHSQSQMEANPYKETVPRHIIAFYTTVFSCLEIRAYNRHCQQSYCYLHYNVIIIIIIIIIIVLNLFSPISYQVVVFS